MGEQLLLNIKLRDDATFANFFSGHNSELLYCLIAQQEPYLYIYGGVGTGKSHLLQAACHLAGEHGKAAAYLPLQEPGFMPQMLEGLEHLYLVAIDDIQQVAGHHDWEIALFNLYNQARETGTHLLIAADQSLQSLPVQLADLRSRLGWGPVFHLNPLSDEEKQQAIQQRAVNRGMQLNDEVAAYLLKNTPRDMRSLFNLLDKLDEASLKAKRKLTIPFVKEYL